MVSIIALWLPILLSAVFVFVVSSVIHMVFTYHRSDYGRIPQETEVMDSLRPYNIPPGEYAVPRAFTSEEMKSEEFKSKIEKGPVIYMTVLPNGMPAMASNFIQWFMYSILISIFAGYIAGRALEPGAEYLAVFRFVGTTAFAAYGLGLAQNSIWYAKSWPATLKSMFDALIYSLVTAGAFGWLWPE